MLPVPGEQIRPEFSTLHKLALSGKPSRRVGVIFGIHDHEQYYRDLYRKAFVHGKKPREFAGQIISQVRANVADDSDFLVILRGYWKGIEQTDTSPTAGPPASVETVLDEMGLKEKPPLDPAKANTAFVEKALVRAGAPGPFYPYDLETNGEWGPPIGDFEGAQ